MHALPNGLVRRRDTHDHLVPDEVWELLAASLPFCPRVEVVMLERLAGTLSACPGDLSADFFRMKHVIETVVDGGANPRSTLPSSQLDGYATSRAPLPGPSDVAELRGYQRALVRALSAIPQASPVDAAAVRAALAAEAPGFSVYVETIDDNMLAIAHAAFSRWSRERET